nr:hypothetical protein [Tanacetum cinerariifolium]
DDIADPRVKVETVSESTSFPPLTRRKQLGERVQADLLQATMPVSSAPMS